MPNHRSFHAPLLRAIDAQALAVPDVDAASQDEFEGNAYYMDLRGFRLADAASVLQRERSIVAGWQESGVLLELEEDESGDDPLPHLDTGVASAVVALSVAGCVPFTSCNAGAFGGVHSAPFPIVRFFAPANVVDLLLSCAEEAGVGLQLDDDGCVELSAVQITDMMNFADTLVARLRARITPW